MSREGERRVNSRALLGVEHRGSASARIVFSLLLAGTLAAGTLIKGCGYKGPLYLPDTAKQPAADKEPKKKSKQQN